MSLKPLALIEAAIIVVLVVIVLVMGLGRPDVPEVPEPPKTLSQETKIAPEPEEKPNERKGLPGEILADFSTPGPRPTGCAWNGSHIWVADAKLSKIFCIDPLTGKAAAEMESPCPAPSGLAFDNGNLWVLGNERAALWKTDPSGKIEPVRFPFPRFLTRPRGLASTGGRLWVGFSEAGGIVPFNTASGELELKDPIIGLSRSTDGLTFDGKYFWASDRLMDAVLVFSKKGEAIFKFPSPGKHPRGLAFDGENLWLVDCETDRLYKLRRTPVKPYGLSEKKRLKIEVYANFYNTGDEKSSNASVTVSLPVDLVQQKLLGPVEYSPMQPSEILTDRWGQRFARFDIPPLDNGARYPVTVSFPVEVQTIRNYFFPEDVGNRSDIPADVGKLYLADGKMLQITSPLVKKAVTEAVGDEKNLYWGMRKIFRFVTESIEFELAGGWDDAPTVLSTGRGSCSEYTFVFIAMCRAWGLPARYAAGTCRRSDDASLDYTFHRWPEVYLPKVGWIHVDPNAGDSPYSVYRAAAIGSLDSNLVITLVGGGDSEVMGWQYLLQVDGAGAGSGLEYERHVEWAPLDEGQK